jgi:predicted dehydrogenase
MSRAVRCAVVGLGSIGRQHLAALSVTKDAKVVGGIDAAPDAARLVPSGVEFSTDLEALDRWRPDAVVVATPESAHRVAVEAALRCGADVLCEKPLATTLEDADAMIDAAEDAGRRLAAAHTLRFDPRYRAVRARVSSGELGELLSIGTRRWMTRSEGELYAGRTTLALCLGVHDIDIIRWIGGEIVRVHAEAGPCTVHPSSADTLLGTLALGSGAIASIDLGWALPEGAGVDWDTQLVVIGTDASGYVELRGGSHGGLMPELTYVADVCGVPFGVVRAQDEQFTRAVAGAAPWPGASPADARRALEVALAIGQSAPGPSSSSESAVSRACLRRW